MSLFKKLFAGSEASPAVASTAAVSTGQPNTLMPSGIQTMKQDLQKKFARGVQYNMKVIIKGDRNVGKTSMWRRLQGDKFHEEYIPTDQIQVASISWNYKVTDDIVKVEVWDIVDKGKRKKAAAPSNLKVGSAAGAKINGQNNSETVEGTSTEEANGEPVLDAEWVDVYKGTHAVFLLFDMTKSWTFSYVENELGRIPTNIPVLVLANHRDMGHHRTVTEEQARFAIDSLERPSNAAPVRYAELSLRNSFGLRYVHQFLNVPFLYLQRETLLRALETNSHEIQSCVGELDALDDSEATNYERFSDTLAMHRRTVQDQLGAEAIRRERERQALAQAQAQAQAQALAPGQSLQTQSVAPNIVIQTNNSVPQRSHLALAPPNALGFSNSQPVSPMSPSLSAQSLASSLVSEPVSAPTPMASNVTASKAAQRGTTNKTKAKDVKPAAVPVVDIDNFVDDTDAGDLNEFLKDDSKPVSNTASSTTRRAAEPADSDDDDGDQPVIQAFAEELDPEDALTLTTVAKVPVVESDDDDAPPQQLVQPIPQEQDDSESDHDHMSPSIEQNMNDLPITPDSAPSTLNFNANELDALEALTSSRNSHSPSTELVTTEAKKVKTGATKKKSKVKQREETASDGVSSNASKPTNKKTTKAKKTDGASVKRKPKVTNVTEDYDAL